MEIRNARPDELPAINEIYNQAVRQGFCTAHLEQVSMAERKQWFASHEPTRFPFFVTLDEGVSGWISLGPYREGRQALSHVAATC
jgi:L-amino acid N-acyltransferase YncA